MNDAAQDLDKVQRAEKLFKAKKFGESEGLLRSLVASPHVGPRAQCDLGVLCIQTERIEEAETLFRSVIDGGHRVAEAYYGIGVIFEEQDPGYARAHYEFALGINPNHTGCHTRLDRLEQQESETDHHEEDASEPDTLVSKSSRGDSKTDPTREGIAKNVRVRTEPRGSPPRAIQIIEFSLHRADGLEPVPVYMSGFRSKGTVKEGDRIKISGRRPKRGRTYETDRLFNESTNTHVEMSGLRLGDSDPGKILGMIVFIIVVIGFVVAFASRR